MGDSQLLSVVGDEVIIISSSADILLSTAILMLQNTSKENRFLQVHGGLHYGSKLLRNNNYFGTTINLAARITSVANPGAFWCSPPFIKALSDPSTSAFVFKGKYQLKNIAEEMELFDLGFNQ